MSVGADFRSPSVSAGFLTSFILAEGGRAECPSLSRSGDTCHSVALPIPVEGSGTHGQSQLVCFWAVITVVRLGDLVRGACT